MTRILHLSDPHFGAADAAVAEAFLNTAAAIQPDITILSGDLTMRARGGELTAARAFVARLPRPCLVIPGNHDIPSINQPFDRFFHPFKRYQDSFGGDLEPELISNRIHVVSMNSSRAFGFHADWSEGRLSTRQLDRIREQFGNSPGDHLRILLLHHPLLELQIKGRTVVRPLEKLMRTIEQARVDVVMCGHFHRSQILAAGLTNQWRTIISQAPTVCSTRLQGEPQGFHDLVLSDERIEVTRHTFQNPAFVAAGSTVFERKTTGWSDVAASNDH